MALTSRQILDLNRSDRAAQNAELGTKLNDCIVAKDDVEVRLGDAKVFHVHATAAQSLAASVPVTIGAAKVGWIVQIFAANGLPVAVSGAAFSEGVLTVTATAIAETDAINIIAW